VLIIFKVGTLYSPLKIFLPVAAGFFGIGLLNYVYTYTAQGTFTNVSAVLLMSTIVVFIIGLVSEQVTALMYTDSDRD
jgi:predicted PurR-regulated permease PerM